MPNDLYLFTFPSEVEAKRVLQEGIWRWEGGGILLDKWHPVAGCYRRREENKDHCICLFGLLIHLWGKATFEKIGALCGGLEEVVHQHPESCEWVLLKVRWPEEALAAVWFSNGVLGYRVTIWRREMPRVFPLGEENGETSDAGVYSLEISRRYKSNSLNFESMGFRQKSV